MPPFDAGVVTVRLRVWVPPPHIAEQVDQSLQALTAQLTGVGHAWVLQGWLSLRAGQARPPPDGWVTTVRVWVWVPPPQDSLQVDQSLQALTAQSTLTTQAWVLQSWLSLRAGQARPPFDAGVTTVRVRCWVPPPHVFEQTDQSLQALTAQSTGGGHAWLLHGCISARAGQAAPPLEAGVMTARVRPWVPPPQLFEHIDQSLHGPTTQSTGTTQGWALQDWVSVRAGHDLPAFWAGTVTVREWVCVPPPQVLLHADQGPQSLTWQSMGTGGAMQLRTTLP
jgi:hypothetical protein